MNMKTNVEMVKSDLQIETDRKRNKDFLEMESLLEQHWKALDMMRQAKRIEEEAKEACIKKCIETGSTWLLKVDWGKIVLNRNHLAR